VIDRYGIELIHPMREGRSPRQIGRKGLSNHRWIVGYKLCWLVNSGAASSVGCGAGHVHDTLFQPLIEVFKDRMVILGDTGFSCAGGRSTQPQALPARTWNDRMLIETVFSMLTLISHTKKNDASGHRLFGGPVGVHRRRLQSVDSVGWVEARSRWFIPLSIAQFNL